MQQVSYRRSTSVICRFQKIKFEIHFKIKEKETQKPLSSFCPRCQVDSITEVHSRLQHTTLSMERKRKAWGWGGEILLLRGFSNPFIFGLFFLPRLKQINQHHVSTSLPSRTNSKPIPCIKYSSHLCLVVSRWRMWTDQDNMTAKASTIFCYVFDITLSQASFQQGFMGFGLLQDCFF